MSLKPKNVDFNETWSALRETVKGVLTLSSVPRSVWNDRFSDVYSLCVAHPEPLADRLYLETKAFLDAHVRSLLEQVRANGENNLLRAYYQAWSQYSLGCLYLHKLYLYLNQQHIRKQKLSEAEIIYGNLSAALQEQMEVGELGLEIWKKNMIQPLKDSLVSLLLEGIHQDRLGEGNPNSTDIIRGVIQSFVSVEEFKMKGNLCLYEEIFETPFLAASGEYYKLEASRLLQTCDVSLYMERVTLQLKEETLRSQKFLHCSIELLAKYCDSLLRKSAKGMSDTEIDDRLAQSITIFKYIDDKDVFQKFYSRMLAKRLIHQQSQSMDAEEAMINRLKQACGYEFTNKLHRMFTDISVSSDFTNKFNDFLKSTYGCDLGFNFSMYVLQAGAWPLTQTTITSFSVPKELEKAVQKFETFYHKGFSGRKLTWLHHLSQGELKLGYLKKPYQVTMQTFQMAILLQFQEVDSLTCREVQECLQLFDEPFNKHVMGLIESKLLMADNQALGPDTVLRLNKEYTNKRTKFRITTIAHKESPQEIEQTISAVDEDRKLYLQAAIVRIMKSRKVLKHNCLIQEVLRQSKASFAPTINLIKKCIEALIDKQYIERTPHSPDEYSYVA
ncbi:cullin-2 [Schistocerca cancellata]|uniref:cullin-2 n=1 Tax=Schistocerca cancellata TaxID=274614 RepID=UPI002118D5B5|nr:cullin-2 [Schistocerca cancellata]